MGMTARVTPWPAKQCETIRVNLDSLNGGGTFLPPSAALARQEITLPKTDSDLLMALPSFNLSPVAPVEEDLSEPARSTRLMSDTFSFYFLPEALSMKIYLKLMMVIV